MCSALLVDVPEYASGNQRSIFFSTSKINVSHYQGPDLIIVITPESGPAYLFDETIIRRSTRAPTMDKLLPVYIRTQAVIIFSFQAVNALRPSAIVTRISL